jgi:hypothetical protein
LVTTLDARGSEVIREYSPYRLPGTVELAYWRTVVRDTVYRYSTFVTNTSAYVRMST